MIDDLLEKIKPIARFPIIESNLRSADDKTKLNIVKIHAQLLEVNKK